jgi:hypothetical protein
MKRCPTFCCIDACDHVDLVCCWDPTITCCSGLIRVKCCVQYPSAVGAISFTCWLTQQLHLDRPHVHVMSSDNEDTLSQGSFQFIGHSDAHSEDGHSWAGTDDFSAADFAQHPAYFRHHTTNSDSSDESISGVTDILEGLPAAVEDVHVSRSGSCIHMCALRSDAAAFLTLMLHMVPAMGNCA